MIKKRRKKKKETEEEEITIFFVISSRLESYAKTCVLLLNERLVRIKVRIKYGKEERQLTVSHYSH